MCKYCTMNEDNVAEKPIQILKNGDHTFIEKVDEVYRMTSYRKKSDLHYVSFIIEYCPVCGGRLKENGRGEGGFGSTGVEAINEQIKQDRVNGY